MLEAKNLELFPFPNQPRHSVRCKYYDLLHHRDFERDEDQAVKRTFLTQLPEVQKKTRFIVERVFERVRDRRVLFLRDWLKEDHWFPHYGEISHPDDSTQFARALNLYTLLDENFVLANLICSSSAILMLSRAFSRRKARSSFVLWGPGPTIRTFGTRTTINYSMSVAFF